MGLSIRTGMKPKKRFFFKSSESFQDLLHRLASAIGAYLTEKHLDAVSYITMGKETMLVGIHPAEEEVEFYVDQGYLVCAAKTSSAGPGYHAFVIEMLGEIEKRCDIKWDWNNQAQGFFDESDFYTDRDFQKLQDAMARYFKGVSKHILTLESKSLRLSLPFHLHVEDDHFALSPMGVWDKSFFESVVDDSAYNDTMAEAFFAWWHKPQDALFWRNLGLVKIWMDVKWQKPLSKEDPSYQTIESTLSCFEKARALSRDDIHLPDAEIEDLKKLLTHEGDFTPNHDFKGFYRRYLRRHLTGKWSLLIPGYFYESDNTDETTVSYYHGDCYITSTSYSCAQSIRPEHPSDEEFSGSTLQVFDFEEEDRQGKATLVKVEEDGSDVFVLICHITVPGSICTTMIQFVDEHDIPWATQVFKTIKPTSLG